MVSESSALASRSLALVCELNQRLCQSMARVIPDPLAAYGNLARFDLYAGDGHWYRAAAHDAPIDETSFPAGPFYVLSDRDHSTRPRTHSRTAAYRSSDSTSRTP
ncbi:MAG TPA: hypothetical protein PK691_13490 [Thermomicrobiales bacterium]|nr:hypothetical protein [Thermomicrobiales bacterium]